MNRFLRWTVTAAWTVLVLYLMLSPSGEGTNVRWLSMLFGGTEITDAVGHVILYGTLTLLWYQALLMHLSADRAIMVAFAVGLVLGLGLESAQSFVVERGVSLLDFSANLLGTITAAGAVWIRRRQP